MKSADETGSDQEARNDDAYALFGRLSSTRIPNKKEKKEFVLCKFIFKICRKNCSFT